VGERWMIGEAGGVVRGVGAPKPTKFRLDPLTQQQMQQMAIRGRKPIPENQTMVPTTSPPPRQGMDAMSSYGNMGQQSAQTGTHTGFAPNMGGATTAGIQNPYMAAMSNMQYNSYGGMGGTEDSNGGMGGWNK
jgi:hypothetical protein